MTVDEARAYVEAVKRYDWLNVSLVGKDGAGLREATGDRDTTDFYPNQKAAILAYKRLNSWEKCRQIGESYAFAIDSLARARFEPNTTAAHISTDQWESESKQRYVVRSLECLNRQARAEIRLKSESRHRLELETAKGVATINFLAQRSPRGGERVGNYYHEGAHMEKLEEILKGGIAATLMGGFVKMCSTHEGAISHFNQIMTNAENEETGERPHRAWNVDSWPWWRCPAFCFDLEAAYTEAPNMETEQRVEAFGTDRLRDMWESSSLLEFREECECEVVDERYSYFPEDLINACLPHKDRILVFKPVEVNGAKAGALREALEGIDWLAAQIDAKILPKDGIWAWGYDVGRYHNPDAISIGHTPPKDPQTLELNLVITMENMDWPQKEQVISHMMKKLPIVKGAQDKTGMGMQLAAWAEREFGQKAFGVHMTNPMENDLVNNLKIRMEKPCPTGGRRLVLPQWGRLKREFNSIRKKVTAAGNPTYDSQATKDKTHADIFWSVALLNSNYELRQGNYAFQPMVRKKSTSTLPSRGRMTPGGIWTPGR